MILEFGAGIIVGFILGRLSTKDKIDKLTEENRQHMQSIMFLGEH